MRAPVLEDVLTDAEAEALRAALLSDNPEDIVEWHERTGREGPTILALYDALQVERQRWSKLRDHVAKVRKMCTGYPMPAGAAGVAEHIAKTMAELESS